SAARFRYLLIAEAHKSGVPHFHMLLHEPDVANTVRHATLRDQWRYGFTNFKLVSDPRAAGYIAKYLAKDALARVRASKDYGSVGAGSNSQFGKGHDRTDAINHR